MFGLATISKMNTLSAIAKQRKVALGLNTPRGHAKDAEKGRARKGSVSGRDPILQALDDGEEFVRRSQSTT